MAIVPIQVDHDHVSPGSEQSVVNTERAEDPEPRSSTTPKRRYQAPVIIDHGNAQSFSHPRTASVPPVLFLNACDSLEG
jgi:hypothetical protein